MTGSGARDKRDGRGFRRASESARAPLRQAAARYGFAEADVLARWPEAAGEAFAGICRPLRVSYGRSRALGATLLVEAEGARAPEVEMQAPRIVERINAFYGYRAIARLKVTQAGGHAARGGGFAEELAAFRGPAGGGAPPDASATARAEVVARAARNPALRAALARLGSYVLARPRDPKS